MPTIFTPFVYWAQSPTNIFLKVDLKDCKGPSIQFEDRKVIFKAHGVGAQGSQSYGFSIDFYSKINTEESSCKVQDSKVDFNIVKGKQEWWPRVTSTPQKPVWLKIDFDRWQSDDDLNSEEEEVRDVRDDYRNLYNQLQKEEFGYTKEDITRVYLILYNLFMLVGFTYVTSVLGIRYLKDGVNCYSETYETVGNAIKYLHIIQFSEVILGFLGVTKSGVGVPLLQIGGRLFIIYLLIDPEPKLHTDSVLFYLFLAWSVAEIIRYPFYIKQIINIELYSLTWLRYTMWIILYPIGLSCEATVIYKSIVYLDETGNFTLSMPNWYNFSISLITVLRIYLLIFFLPTAYVLLSHMYHARKKNLNTKKWLKTN